jgi:hypothetical protein
MSNQKKIKPYANIPILRSTSFGYVVENFLGENKKGPNKGKVEPWITSNGKICVFPNMESVPPKWRPYAQPASQLQSAQGVRMPFRVNIVTEEEMK